MEQVDLSDVTAVIQPHERLRERGIISIDILINNAGHGLQGPFLDSQLDAALAMVQLDVASLTAVTHIFAQDMRAAYTGSSIYRVTYTGSGLETSHYDVSRPDPKVHDPKVHSDDQSTSADD